MERANVRFGSPLAREAESAMSEDVDSSLEDDGVGEEPGKVCPPAAGLTLKPLLSSGLSEKEKLQVRELSRADSKSCDTSLDHAPLLLASLVARSRLPHAAGRGCRPARDGRDVVGL